MKIKSRLMDPAELNSAVDFYPYGLLSPSILMLCGMREVEEGCFLDTPRFAEKIREWQERHSQQRYVVAETHPSPSALEGYAKECRGWYIIDREVKTVTEYQVSGTWLPDGHCRVPANPQNLKRVKRALALARKREGREFSLRGAIRVLEGHILIHTRYARVNRLARRLLLHDWQQGRLKDVPPMEYPAAIYRRYYVFDGSLGSEMGYLYPDGTFVRVDTSQGEPSGKLSELII